MSIGINRGMTVGLGAVRAGYTPDSLFAAGEAGDWIDPSDLSRMFTDTAGTTRVTADGQSVARIDGKRGIISLRNATNPPIYKTSAGLHWLQFDGSNDSLTSAAALNLTTTDEATVCAALRKASDAASGIVADISADLGSVTGAFALVAPSATGANSYRFTSKGTLGSDAGTGIFAAAPDTAVLTGLGDISGDASMLRRNGALVQTATTDQGTGNFGSHTLYVGARGGASLFFNGNLYFLLIRGALTSGPQLTSLEQFAARKSGVTF